MLKKLEKLGKIKWFKISYQILKIYHNLPHTKANLPGLTLIRPPVWQPEAVTEQTLDSVGFACHSSGPIDVNPVELMF